MADEVWLVRHAETEWSRTGRHTGRTDIPLTDTGRERGAGAAARAPGRATPSRSCSARRSTRARETAQLAGLECSGLRDDLLEWDYGEYEGITTPEIREQRPDWYLWRDGAPGGESPDDVGGPLRPRDRRGAAPSTATSRSSPTATSCARSARAGSSEPVAFGGRLFLGTGSISVLGYEREVACIKLWNG